MYTVDCVAEAIGLILHGCTCVFKVFTTGIHELSAYSVHAAGIFKTSRDSLNFLQTVARTRIQLNYYKLFIFKSPYFSMFPSYQRFKTAANCVISVAGTLVR